MTGAVVAASRPTRAVRTTIPVRAVGGWNFDSGSSNPSLGPVSGSTLDVISATPVGIRLIFRTHSKVNAASTWNWRLGPRCAPFHVICVMTLAWTRDVMVLDGER